MVLYTAAQVAGILNVTKQTVYRLGQNGALKTVRIGAAVRFVAADVEAFIRRGGAPLTINGHRL